MNPSENEAAGRGMHALAADLYPFCRSISGDGVRTTLARLAREIPLETHEVSGAGFHIEEFHPYGYDERQYGSPGINLPVGCLMRSPHGTFPEDHTSADNLAFIKPGSLADTLTKAIEAIEVIEHNTTYLNLKPMCEPRLGKYGLYGGGQRVGEFSELALLWVLNQSDGSNDLLAIAERSGMSFRKILSAATSLEQAGVLRKEAP